MVRRLTFLPMNAGSWSMCTKFGRACILLASASSHSSMSALQHNVPRQCVSAVQNC